MNSLYLLNSESLFRIVLRCMTNFPGKWEIQGDGIGFLRGSAQSLRDARWFDLAGWKALERWFLWFQPLHIVLRSTRTVFSSFSISLEEFPAFFQEMDRQRKLLVQQGWIPDGKIVFASRLPPLPENLRDQVQKVYTFFKDRQEMPLRVFLDLFSPPDSIILKHWIPTWNALGIIRSIQPSSPNKEEIHGLHELDAH